MQHNVRHLLTCKHFFCYSISWQLHGILKPDFEIIFFVILPTQTPNYDSYDHCAPITMVIQHPAYAVQQSDHE